MFKNFLLAISFFTILPAKQVEFTKENYKYLPLMMGLVGVIIGAIAYGLLRLLSLAPISPLLQSVLFCGYCIGITGGLHTDGLLDTMDAHFSRRDVGRKLEIMHDSTIGAFACIGFMVLYSIKVAVVRELLLCGGMAVEPVVWDTAGLTLINMAVVLVVSRLFVGFTICTSRFARNEGLAKMYSQTITGAYKYILLVQLLVVGVALWVFALSWILVLSGFLMYGFFTWFTRKSFGGITGDTLGALLEVTELWLYATLLVEVLWV